MTGPSGPVTRHVEGATIDLRVQPRASRNEIGEVYDGALRLRVTAPPVEGAANAAVVDLLAQRLGTRKSDLEILRGDRGRTKRVLVRGMSADDVMKRLDLA
jgi:uncharacterized protein (TIGR00251 family)